jgi:hypothetical protein
MELFSFLSSLPLLLATFVIIANSCYTAAEAFLSSNPAVDHHHQHTNTFRLRRGGDNNVGDGSGGGGNESSLSNSVLLSTLINNRGGGAFGQNLGGNRGDRSSSTRSSAVGRAASSAESSAFTATSSSSSSSTSTSTSTSFTPPIFKKTKQERDFIKNVLHANFIFQDFCRTTNTGNNNRNNINDELGDLSEIICAFEEVDFTIDSLLCKQGDIYDTDYLYIIYE